MFKKAYLEITNVCNLSCSFCPGTARAPRFLPPEDFAVLAGRLQGHAQFLYLHLMGEPLLHPQLPQLLETARALGFRVIVTTNGTLLPRTGAALLDCPALYRVNVSLHAHEANEAMPALPDYIEGCAAFAASAAARGVRCTLRLWNGSGQQAQNAEIVRLLEQRFPAPWPLRGDDRMLCEGVYLQRAERFDWPVQGADDLGQACFCRGLRDQVGVLCDGTVVPCCLDSEGVLRLGNLFEQTLDEILAGPRARASYEGFSRRQAVEPQCRRCAYARRF